ncbi:MAG TPA: TonB-dependent receptor [Flavobacteriales bacterium]
MLRCGITALLLVLTFVSRAQSATVTGRLLTADGPLAFAPVHLRNTTLKAVTEENGRFRIENIPQGKQVLVAKALGQEPLEHVFTVDRAGVIDLGELRMTNGGKDLDEVVVTSTMRPISRSESPVPVEVITPTLFRKNPSPALFDAVGMVNGVRPQINCSVCNTGDIHINGMEGPYTMVLIDGMPIVSGLSTVYGLSGIPTSLVERVEVVKGPGSALYGSEAMGGLINVITKDPALAPQASVDLMTTSWLEHNADIGLRLGQGRVNDLVGINVFDYSDPRDRNADGFTDVTLQRRVSVFNTIRLQRPQHRLASLAARYVHEDRWGGQLDWTSAHAGSDSIYGESINTKRWELIGQYQLPVATKLMAQVSLNGHAQRSWYGITPYNAQQHVLFGQLYWSHRAGLRHDLLSGIAYRYTLYNDNTFATSVLEDARIVDAPQRRPLPGIFVQDEWSITELHKLLLGFRLDHDPDHGLVQSPRVAYKFAPNGRWAIRANVGTGFRVVNVFTEDHAALTGARRVVIEEDLLPERSINGTVNIVRRWPGEKRSLVLDLSLFHTAFTDRILPDYDSDPDLILYRNLNGSALSRGISLNVESRLGGSVRLLAGATYMDVSTTRDGIRREQYFAPDWSGTFTLSTSVRQHWSIDLTGQWYGPMFLPTLPNDFRPDHSPTYALLNVQLKRKIGDRWELYGGVKNLLDFVPRDPLMRPFDPFDRHAGDTATNPYGYTFDTTYMYAPIQGLRGFVGVRWVLGA